MDFVIAPFVVGGGTDAYIENLVAFREQILNLLGIGLAGIFQRDSIDQSTNDKKIVVFVNVTQITSFVLEVFSLEKS